MKPECHPRYAIPTLYDAFGLHHTPVHVVYGCRGDQTERKEKSGKRRVSPLGRIFGRRPGKEPGTQALYFPLSSFLLSLSSFLFSLESFRAIHGNVWLLRQISGDRSTLQKSSNSDECPEPPDRPPVRIPERTGRPSPAQQSPRPQASPATGMGRHRHAAVKLCACTPPAEAIPRETRRAGKD